MSKKTKKNTKPLRNSRGLPKKLTEAQADAIYAQQQQIAKTSNNRDQLVHRLLTEVRVPPAKTSPAASERHSPVEIECPNGSSMAFHAEFFNSLSRLEKKQQKLPQQMEKAGKRLVRLAQCLFGKNSRKVPTLKTATQLAEKLKDYDEPKYIWQRIVRRWDDPVIWGIDHHLIAMLPQWLDRMTGSKHLGCPGYLMDKDRPDDENFQRWKDMLRQMADGFRAAEALANHGSPIHEEAEQEYVKRYGEPYTLEKVFEGDSRWDALCAELRVSKRDKVWHKEQQARFKAGWKLMGEHFFSLWD